jgi:archaellum biogenesis ATPase FlaH
MPKAMLVVSYGIKPDHREEYLTLSREMKMHFVNTRKKNYGVFESENKKNQFTEVLITESLEELEMFDEGDEILEGFMARLTKLVDAKGIKFNTLVESE